MYCIVLHIKQYSGGIMDSQLKKGLLDVCVLSVLRRGESYGYKILSDVAPCIEIAESTLYPILKRLEAAGCVRSRTEAHQRTTAQILHDNGAGRGKDPANFCRTRKCSNGYMRSSRTEVSHERGNRGTKDSERRLKVCRRANGTPRRSITTSCTETSGTRA